MARKHTGSRFDETVPFDPTLTPEQKGKDFDQQYRQNRKYTDSPAAASVGAEKAKGRHRK